MSRHPIRAAFEHLDDELSAEFRDALRLRFLSEVQQPSTSTTADGGTRADRSADQEETIVITTEEPHRTESHRKESRRRVVAGIAAAIIVIVGVTAVVLSRRPETTRVDTSQDPAIATESLVGADQLGSGFSVSHDRDSWTSTAIAAEAAAIETCTPYLDYAFDSPGRNAVTAGEVFNTPLLYWMTQWVYLFPTEEAASKAMDKISEPGFALCLNDLRQKMYDFNPRGAPTTVTTVDAPEMLPHGDRQVVIGQHGTFGSFGNLDFTIMNVFVQVGRGIVYVDPNPDFHDSTDPAGRLDKAVVAATKALVDALAAKPKG